MSFYKKHKNVIWYSLLLFTMLFSYAVFGPLIQRNLIDVNKPYIVVDSDLASDIVTAKAKDTPMCQIPPYTPIEMSGNPSGKTVDIYMNSVPVEYIPFVHYPESWNEWWNIFNPNQPFGPILMNVLYVVTPLLAIGLIIYSIYLWKRGNLKEALKRLLPHD